MSEYCFNCNAEVKSSEIIIRNAVSGNWKRMRRRCMVCHRDRYAHFDGTVEMLLSANSDNYIASGGWTTSPAGTLIIGKEEIV